MNMLADELALFADDFFRALLDLLLFHRFVCLGDLVFYWLFLGGGSVFGGLLDDGFGLGRLSRTFDEETLDLGGFLADSIAEKIKLGATDATFFHDFDLSDGGSFDGKNFLDADVIDGDFSNNKGF